MLMSTEYLNLRLVTYWIAVVEEGSITAAAKRLSIPQPALSQQIRTLEQVLGATLLDRHPSGVRPTDAGRAFLPEARAVIAAASRAQRAIEATLRLEGGMLELATYGSMASGPLLASLAKWQRQHPRVPVRLIEVPWRLIAEHVERGEADFGIGMPPTHWTGPTLPIGWDEFVLVVADPLGPSDDPVHLEEFADRPWVLYDRRLGLAQLTSRACATVGFQPRPAIETLQVDSVARLAAAGIGPALVPRRNLPPDLAWAARRTSPTFVWPIVAFTSKTWSTAAAAYLEILRAEDWPAPDSAAVHLSVR